MNFKKPSVLFGAVVIVGFFIALGYGLYIAKNQANFRSALLNGTYVFEGDQVITLKDGATIGPLSPRHNNQYETKIIGTHTTIDLNNDGRLDAFSYFTRTELNSSYGPENYIAGVINTEDGFKGTNAVFLGGNITPGNIENVEGYLTVHYQSRFPDPKMTPINQAMYLKLVKGQLINASDEYRDAHPPTPITDADEAPVRLKAKEVLTALKNKDVTAFKSLIHPTLGVRFGTYGQVSEGNVNLTSAQIAQHIVNNDKILWGISDGKGDEIWRTFKDYFENIYQYDYLNAPTASYKRIFAGGTAGTNNVGEFYMGKPFINFFFPYTTSYLDDDGKQVNNEMSWNALNLVFDKYNGEWYVIGIVSDQWAI